MFKQVLHGIRVLDLAPGWPAYTGRLLGDLGAEVIKIEPPEGDPLRGTGDFEHLNANKYGCTLDAATSDGIAKLERLVVLSDIFIATPTSVDLDALMAANSSLIVVTLQPEATVEEAIAAAAGVGVALWDRRRTGVGSRIDVAPRTDKLFSLPDAEARRELVSTLAGDVLVESCPWRLSEAATHIRLPAPALGEHTTYVLELLRG